ncbi:hypothetical protein PhCBS80983_g04657 [Powellomyces hirtus]|uniref:J domain-containing protein n=1 Tax=Powellomyces hirtus TaxID=109895 RepID=A0A507DX09_9FUNG|nr:hypothetical protein PhCBS80983_g04657 [Powellomyces hirtus]
MSSPCRIPTLRRLILALLVLVAVVGIPGARAWEQEDYNIFDLNDALKAATAGRSGGNKDVDFYSVFDVARTATSGEIQKAYRHISRALHPDKNPEEKAHALYTVLTSIVTLLKDPEQRERYDGHLRNGIPTWRGAGYFYNHYKPGIPDIILILIVATSFVQYVSGWLIYMRRRGAVEEAQASVNNLTYQQVRKQLKRRGGSGNNSPNLSRKAFKNASPLQLLHDGADPDYIPEALINEPPKFKNTLIVRLPFLLFSAIMSIPRRLAGKAAAADEPAVVNTLTTNASIDDNTPRTSESEGDDSGSDSRRMRRRRKDATLGKPAKASAPKEGPWTLSEIKTLVELTKTYPPSTPGRWSQIASELGRPQQQVSEKAKEISDNPRLVLK